MKRRNQKFLKKLSLQLICYMVLFDSISLSSMNLEEEKHQEKKKILRKNPLPVKDEKVSILEFFGQNADSEEDQEKKAGAKKLTRRASYNKVSTPTIFHHLEKSNDHSIVETKNGENSTSSLSPEESQKSSSFSLSMEELQRTGSSSLTPENPKSHVPSPIKTEKSKKRSSSPLNPEEPQKDNSSSTSKEKVKRTRSSSRTDKLKMSSIFSSKAKILDKSSSSSLSPTSEEKEAEDPSISITKNIVTGDISYMDCAAYLLNKCKFSSETEKTAEMGKRLMPSEIGKILVYSYTIFTDEKHLFAHFLKLKQTYPMEITTFLEQLVLADFPNGIQNLQLAEAEFNELKKGLVTSPKFNISYLNNFTFNELINNNIKKISDALIQNELYDLNKINVQNLDIAKFTNALLARDRHLFEASFKDIKAFTEKQTSPPESILAIEKHGNRTGSSIALVIVSCETPHEKNKLFKLFCCIGTVLLKSNFHGAMQIGMALNKLVVQRLISKEILKDQSWKTISEFLSYSGNYKNYRTRVSELRGEGFFPVFSTFNFDLQHDFIEYKTAKDLQNKSGALGKIAMTLETFLRYRTLPYPDVDPEYSKMVCGFKNVDDEALEIFSDLWTMGSITKDIAMDRVIELKNWTSRDLAFFLQKNGCEIQVPIIFRKGIHNGNDIIAYMGEGNIEEKEQKLSELKINKKMIDAILLSQDLNDFKR